MGEAAAPRKQPLLKLFIRLMLPIVTLAGFGGVASIAMLGVNPGKIVGATFSPDGRYRARILEAYADYGCGRSTSFVVLVERRWNYIKTGSVSPFCFFGSPSQLAINWINSETLSITCTGCDPESTFTYGQNWGRLHFASDVQRQ